MTSFLAGCDDGDKKTNNNVNNVNNVTPETVVTVCTKVMSCGGWGWEDQATCETGFIDNPELQTECADSAAYFLCMPTCMAEECTEFATCEGDCWTNHCMAK